MHLARGKIVERLVLQFRWRRAALRHRDQEIATVRQRDADGGMLRAVNIFS